MKRVHQDMISAEYQSGSPVPATPAATQVTYYEDAPEAVVAAGKALGGATTDILCAAYSDGASLLAAGCYGGDVLVYNVEAGSLRARLLPPGHQERPQTEQPIEKVGPCSAGAWVHGSPSTASAAPAAAADSPAATLAWLL
jgi:hypothetical protein